MRKKWAWGSSGKPIPKMSQRAHGVLTVRSQCFALMTWTQKGWIEQKNCVVLWYDVVRCGTSVKPLDPLVWKKAEESAFTFFTPITSSIFPLSNCLADWTYWTLWKLQAMRNQNFGASRGRPLIRQRKIKTKHILAPDLTRSGRWQR